MSPADCSACSSMSASVTSGIGEKKKTTASRKTKAAMPRYVHCTLEMSFGLVSSKKTREANRGATGFLLIPVSGTKSERDET